MMLAIVNESYGTADVMKLKSIKKPTPGPDEVLIKVHASSANAADWHLLYAEPFPVRFAFGLFAPMYKVLGGDVAGVVEAVGANVKQFKVGDEVFGDLTAHRFGGFGQYALSKENTIYFKPTNMSFEQAGAFGTAGGTALQALRDAAKVKPGQKVLINGASGGVGTFAVQIAKAYGAEVTAVCSTKNVETVKGLGADRVLDYTKEDFTTLGEKYDVIFDAAATKSVFKIVKVLNENGIYLNVGGDTLGHTLFWSMFPIFGSKKIKLFMVTPKQQDMKELKELAEAGKVTPCIENVYPLKEVPNVIKLLYTRRARGKHVINVLDAQL